MEQEASIETMIDYATSEVLQTADIVAQIEIATRFVEKIKDQLDGLKHIDKIMKKGKVKRKYFALSLIEI